MEILDYLNSNLQAMKDVIAEENPDIDQRDLNWVMNNIEKRKNAQPALDAPVVGLDQPTRRRSRKEKPHVN